MWIIAVAFSQASSRPTSRSIPSLTTDDAIDAHEDVHMRDDSPAVVGDEVDGVEDVDILVDLPIACDEETESTTETDFPEDQIDSLDESKSVYRAQLYHKEENNVCIILDSHLIPSRRKHSNPAED